MPFRVLTRRRPFLVATRAKLAGRTGAAAIAPGMPRAPLAAIAGMAYFDHQPDQSLAAELMRKLPGLGLRQPHQRRVDGEGNLGAEPDRLSKRAQRRVAAIGIA